MNLGRFRLSPALLVAVGAFVFALGGGALAAIPGSDGAIHACYKKEDGQLRVIDTAQSQTCNKSEVALAWNQTGPTGPQGAKGDTGPQGAKGDTGAQGTPGPEWVVSGFVNPDGSLFVANKDPGTTVTVSHQSTGVYLLSATGLGTDCPLPALTPAAGEQFGISFGGGSCGDGSLNATEVLTADGSDHSWSFTIVGTDPPGGATSQEQLPG